MEEVTRRTLPGALALVLAAAGPALAQEPARGPDGDSKSWGTPLVISAADFRTNGQDRERFFFSPNGYLTGDGETILMIAPVYLPTGSTVRRVSAHVYDNSSSCSYPDITVWLNRVGANVGTGMQTMASMATSGARSSMQTISNGSIYYAGVDTFRYNYYAAVMMCSAAHELHSVVVYYEE